jgi:hypothetical protein
MRSQSEAYGEFFSAVLTRDQLMRIAEALQGELIADRVESIKLSYGFVSSHPLDNKWVAEQVLASELVNWLVEAERLEGARLGTFDVHLEIPDEQAHVTFHHDSQIRFQAITSNRRTWLEKLVADVSRV